MSGQEIELGKKYRDTITGYEGIAVARTEWLNGCIRWQLERADKDGVPETHAFDEQQLVSAQTGAPARATKKPGGPRKDTSRPRETASR